MAQIKISELELNTQMSNEDVLAGVDTSEQKTKKFKLETLKTFINKEQDEQITKNKNDISANATNIETNTENISKNSENIEKNAQDIVENKENIADNTNRTKRIENTLYDSGEANGTSINIKDSTLAEFQEITIDGVCKQVTTTGKNLFNTVDLDKTIYTSNGVTTTWDNDVITVNGTPTSNWANITRQRHDVLEIGTYTISIDKEQTFDVAIKGNYEDDSVFQFDINIGEKSRTFTTTKNIKFFYFFIKDLISDVAVNGVFKVQLEASPTATDFEPYTGGQASPSPAYPQNIEVLEDYNLFDKDNANLLNTYIDGVNGNLGNNDTTYRTLYIPCEPNTIYTIIKKQSHRFVISSANTTPTINGTTKKPVSVNAKRLFFYRTTEDAKYLVVYYYIGTTDTLTEKEIRDSICIAKGQTGATFAPYKTFPIISSNKNIYDATQEKNTITNGNLEYGADNSKFYLNGIGDNDQHQFKAQLFRAGTYTLTCEVAEGTFTGNVLVYMYEVNGWARPSMNELGINPSQLKAYTKFTLEKDTILALGVFASNTTEYDNLEIKYQIVTGDKIDYNFEQHLSQVTYLPIPNGEFIGKINENAKDQVRIAFDEEKGEYQSKLDKNIGRDVLNGSENIFYAVEQGDYYLFQVYNHNALQEKPLISNKLIYANNWGTSNNVEAIFNTYNYNGTIIQVKILSSRLNEVSIDGVKEYLSQNPIEYYYPLAEPYEVDLGAVDMPLTYSPETNVFTTSELEAIINAKYYRNFINTIQNLQVNEKALKDELVDIQNQLKALQVNVSNLSVLATNDEVESEVIE